MLLSELKASGFVVDKASIEELNPNTLYIIACGQPDCKPGCKICRSKINLEAKP